MKAYILTFILCTLFCYISDLFFSKKNHLMTKISMVISIFILCLLAALRSEYVGRDVHNYLTMLFRDFSNGISLIDELKSVRARGIEPLFMLLVLLTSKFHNLHLVFFFVELAVDMPIFILAYQLKMKNNIYITLTVFLFLMTMYAYSFSMMRQSIAIAIGMLALFYYTQSRKKTSLALLVVAFLFHRTAVIIILLLFTYGYILKTKNDKQLYLYVFITIVLGAFIGLLLPNLVSFLPDKYSIYLDPKYRTSFNFISLMKKMVFLLPTTLLISNYKDNNSEEKMMIWFSQFLIVFDIIFYLFGLRVPEISRICLYFSNYYYFILIPILVRRIKPKVLGVSMMIVLLFFMWHHMTTGNNQADIYPYKSDIIQFLNE